ncbi:hypothetical protein [Streptomyces sp. NPDC059564]|uniref:hypothetical protein n=1 Tax=Streptomyces sp. NPDC059564 TaxID=3346865 RepID=UPI003675E862
MRVSEVLLMVWQEVRGKLLFHPVWWLLWSILSAVVAAAVFAFGVLSGWGNVTGAVCGDSYDTEFALQHVNDPLFPLHNWCNAEHDLVPSWVNPTVAGLAGLSVICLIMTVALGVVRLIRGKQRREQTV